MSDDEPDDQRTFLDVPAKMYRHDAKVTLLQMIHLKLAFASGASITTAAERAEVHRDTAKDIFMALRDRLANPRFKKWRQSEYANPALTNAQDREQMTQAQDALFLCHENIECKKRHRAGRRKSIVCRSCPLFAYVRDHVPERAFQYAGTENLVHVVYDVINFYARLGWNESVNSGETAREVFDKRFRHFEVISLAIENTVFDENGKILSDEDNWLSIRHLAKALSEELREDRLGTGD